MRTLFEPARPDAAAPTVMVLLPAAYTAPQDFLTAGFVAAVRERQLPWDLLLVELKLEHVTERSLLECLQQQVIQPAQARGYASIWICGISIGAFVALSYAERYGGDVAGLCLLAPYLGSHILIDEIERAGGLRAWQTGEMGGDDDERRIWSFIKACNDQPIRIHLGLGSEDRFARGQRALAAALPANCVDIVPGRHDWPVWRRLWDNFLDGWHTPP